jgi:hypothetical protein
VRLLFWSALCFAVLSLNNFLLVIDRLVLPLVDLTPWRLAAALAAPLLAVTWAWPDSRWGQAAAIVLIAGSAVTAGRLLAGVAPLTLLKVGVVAMAILDAVLVFSENLQPANAVLVAASPGAGLPQLQSASFGYAGLGYGDFFAAAVVGAIFAAEGRHQWLGALAVLVASLAWDQLFAYFDTLPATVPPAVVLVVFWALGRRRAGTVSERPQPDAAFPPERRSTAGRLPS